jgi:hypothetical protein
MPVTDWLSFSCEVGKFSTQGSATLIVRANDPWITMTALDISGIEYGAALSLDVYWQNMTTPLLSGPTTSVKMVEDRSGARIEFTFERWAAHFLNRRINLSSTYAKFDAAPATADNALATLLRNNGFDAGATITPIGYPATRTDFGPVAVTTPAGGGAHATTVNIDVSDGRRLLEEAERLMEAYSMNLTLAETSAGVFTLTVDPTYQGSDLTDQVRLSLVRGSVTEYSETVDYSALENTLSLASSSGGGTRSFTHDATSVTDYGVYEGAYAPTQYDTTAAGEEGSYLKTRFANPTITYDCATVDQPGATFNVDYAIADLVTVESAAWGRTTEQLVIGAKIDARGRFPVASAVLGAPRQGYNPATREGAGTMLGRGRGLGTRYGRATP